MDIDFPKDPKRLRKFNMIRYRSTPPSWELIEQVIEKSGLKMLARFEYAWLIPKDTLTLYKNGERGLPARYWHIFYDFNIVNQKYSKLNTKRTKEKKSHAILHTNKLIINGSKQNANCTR